MSFKYGYKDFCAACKGSREENGKLVCEDKQGRFYGLTVNHVLLAPCMKLKDEIERKVKQVAGNECR